MKKFERLLAKIENYSDLDLDLTDFGLEQEQINQLVNYLNKNKNIKILILKHNALDDSCVAELAELSYIESLDLSYNNFTQVGIDQLKKNLKEKIPSFNIYSEYNNNNPIFFSSSIVKSESSSKDTTELSVDSCAGALVAVVLDKLSEISLSSEQMQLVKEKFIYILTHNDQIFEVKNKELQANKMSIQQ